MFLILDQDKSDFSSALACLSDRRGIETLVLTPPQVINDVLIEYQLTDSSCQFSMQYGGRHIDSVQIRGVYCGIHVFPPELWSWFSPEDAQYAARETNALWLTILSSMDCPVLNPPGLDSLAGTVPTPVEFVYAARACGFEVAMVAYLESGKVAAELAERNPLITFSDLGQEYEQGNAFKKTDLLSPQTADNHIRVREFISGKNVWVTLVGERCFVSAVDGISGVHPLPPDAVPSEVKDKLVALHKSFNLNLAEYLFSISDEGIWTINDLNRLPVIGEKAFGDKLYGEIVAYAIGE